MARTSKTLLSMTTALALASPFSFADENKPIFIDQVQLGNVWSNIEVHADRAERDVVAAGLAVSNTTTVYVGDGPVDVAAKQVSEGNVQSSVDIWAGDVADGYVTSSSTATGNSAYVGNWYGDANAVLEQSQKGNITALSNIDAETAWDISTHTTAVANTAEVESDYGEKVEALPLQSADAEVFASSQVNAGDVGGFIQNVSIAAGNSASTHVDDVTDPWVLGVQETAKGSTVTSVAETNVDWTGDVITASNAAGNTYTVSSIDSKTFAGAEGNEIFQGNEADVFAAADTNAGIFYGAGTATAQGVGNGFHISSLGGETQTNTIQNNFGAVGTEVTLNARDFSGGTGIAAASSIGNSFSAATQDSRLSGPVRQLNDAPITSTARVNVGRGGTVAATSTAIGNSAAFESNRGD